MRTIIARTLCAILVLTLLFTSCVSNRQKQQHRKYKKLHNRTYIKR